MAFPARRGGRGGGICVPPEADNGTAGGSIAGRAVQGRWTAGNGVVSGSMGGSGGGPIARIAGDKSSANHVTQRMPCDCARINAVAKIHTTGFDASLLY